MTCRFQSEAVRLRMDLHERDLPPKKTKTVKEVRNGIQRTHTFSYRTDSELRQLEEQREKIELLCARGREDRIRRYYPIPARTPPLYLGDIS